MAVPESRPARLDNGNPKARRPSTAHLKVVPPTRELRDRIRALAADTARSFDRTRPLSREFLQGEAEKLLDAAGLPRSYTGFAMVCLSNEFWRDQFMAVDFRRRMLLLPHCLKHADGCPADYDEFGLQCEECGACVIADFKRRAEELGYKVLVAEGTPIVLKIIVSGYVDAILGVACLDVLEKAFNKVLQVGVPAIAVPLLSNKCKDTSVDEDWVAEVIEWRTEPPPVRTRTYVPLMRFAKQLFEPGTVEQFMPRSRLEALPEGADPMADPVAATEAIAFDFLARGGRRFRPFITLASYDAVTGGAASQGVAVDDVQLRLPRFVCRAAMAIEVFHKASLVHDDIEDDDPYRYGRETLHRAHGVPIALNVGDYLIGLGYRLLKPDEGEEVAPDAVADVLRCMADAHLKLAEGQGAELIWRDSGHKRLTPLDALRIYALKTAPAFEAALYTGLRLAGPVGSLAPKVSAYTRHVGIAFQIINDLKDWDGDDNNKLLAGQDALSARPTLLLALAMDAGDRRLDELLQRAMNGDSQDVDTVYQLRTLFAQLGVFDKACRLVEKYRERAREVACQIDVEPLRDLLLFLLDTVLDYTPGEQLTASPLPVIQPT